MSQRAKVIGYVLGAIHLAGVVATVIAAPPYEEQAILVWIPWYFIDFPIGHLFFVVGRPLGTWLASLEANHPFLADYVYPLSLIHGVLGTLWWVFLPRIVTSKTMFKLLGFNRGT